MDAQVKKNKDLVKKNTHFAANTINHYQLTHQATEQICMFFTTQCEKHQQRVHPFSTIHPSDAHLSISFGCLSTVGMELFISQPDIKVIYSHGFTVWHSHVNTHRQVKERNLYVTLT